jgi:hypothetical protein
VISCDKTRERQRSQRVRKDHMVLDTVGGSNNGPNNSLMLM